MAQTLLSEVVNELGDGDSPVRDAPISRDQLDRWINSDDIDVLGATYALLSDPRHVARIQPSIQLEEAGSFLQRYFLKCLRDNPESEWADSRYSAGWDIARLFGVWWRNAGVSREYLASWKNWLANAYLNESAAVRECIETAALEHIFEVEGMSEFFADWLKHPDLAAAYRRSLSGPQGHFSEDSHSSD